MTGHLASLAALVACAVLARAPAVPKEPVDLPIYVTVTDLLNQPVAGLTAEDFEALVDGMPVPITAVRPRGTLSMAVVIDQTRSTGWGRVRTILAPQEEVLAVLSGLGKDDRLRFGFFGREVKFKKPWAPRWNRNLPEELEDALYGDDRDAHGPSPIWDVIYDTVQMLAKEPPPRALLILTDGRSTGNARSIDLVADYAAIHGVAIHSVSRYAELYIPQGDARAIIVRPWIGLERLATYTGGTAVGYRIQDKVQGLLLAEQLGRAIRASYQLGIPSPADGLLHRLEVRCRRSNLKVSAPRAFR